MQAAASAASVPALCCLASCDAGHVAAARDAGGGKAEGLPNQHLSEAQLPAWPDPALKGKELPLSFSCELLLPLSALQRDESLCSQPEQDFGTRLGCSKEAIS